MEVDPAIPTVQAFTTPPYPPVLISPSPPSRPRMMWLSRVIWSALSNCAVGWKSRLVASAPTLYTVSAYGNYTLYPWAKDAAGNVSMLYPFPANVIVTPALTFTISGNAGIGGATLAYIDNGPKNVTSAPDGSYSNTIHIIGPAQSHPACPVMFLVRLAAAIPTCWRTAPVRITLPPCHPLQLSPLPAPPQAHPHSRPLLLPRLRLP